MIEKLTFVYAKPKTPAKGWAWQNRPRIYMQMLDP